MVNFSKRLEKDKIKEILRKPSPKIYFVGIGGISMSSLAVMLKVAGARVMGSDIRKTELTDSLSKRGIIVRYSHSREAIMAFQPDLVVFSLSVNENNAEYKTSLDMRVPSVTRSELLGAIIDGYETSIGVSGSHGKSTVTALLGELLKNADLNPTVLCGAEIDSGLGLILGEKHHLVYEGCEYGDSFLNFSPDVALLLNLDLDHTDYFKSEEMIRQSFLKSANNAKKACILNLDSKNLAAISEKITPTLHTFSKTNAGEYRYEALALNKGSYSFDLYCKNELIGEYRPRIKGGFNMLNAVASAVAADVIGIPYVLAKQGVEKFCGLKRRLELIKSGEKIDLFYDYAHHPCEISATNDALRDMGYKNICVIFAPHTYSRTAYFLESFASELAKFESAYVTDIYGARETAIVGVNSNTLSDSINVAGGNSHAVSECEIFDVLNAVKKSNTDCIVLMGAGEIGKYKEEFMKI